MNSTIYKPHLIRKEVDYISPGYDSGQHLSIGFYTKFCINGLKIFSRKVCKIIIIDMVALRLLRLLLYNDVTQADRVTVVDTLISYSKGSRVNSLHIK